MGDDVQTHYVRSGAGHVVYQVLSEGEPSILLINESVLPIEALHDNVNIVSYVNRLRAWGRVIAFDRRGVGLSDPVSDATTITLDDWVADAVAVLDAVGSARAVVLSSGPSAGLIAILMASRWPERVQALGLYDAIARYRWAPDHPWGITSEYERELDAQVESDWGTERIVDRRGRFPATVAKHPELVEFAVKWFRRGASPSRVKALNGVLRSSDVRAELSTISCPTLILNHVGTEDGPYLAEHIPNARLVELDENVHLVFSDELDIAMAALSELVNGTPLEPATRRVLTTLLFTDIVDSTASAAAVGDRRWNLALDGHDDMVRRHLRRFDGDEIKTTGDGFVAAFDGPTRAVQCALAIQHDAQQRRVAIRAGVHTGEVERRHNDVLGLTVHVAQRICALAVAGQVLVSRQVVDLVTGSELRFENRGDHPLKGLEGSWTIFEAAPTPGRTSPTTR
jgi:class 3 adenylate cyclase